MGLKTILIDSAKIEKISDDKGKLNLNILPLDENNDLEPNASLKLYINNELAKTLISDESGETIDSFIVDIKDDNLKIQVKDVSETIKSKIKVLFDLNDFSNEVNIKDDEIKEDGDTYNKLFVSKQNSHNNINVGELFDKKNMTDDDKERMKFILKLLEEQNLLDYKNIKKLIDNVSYGTDHIFVGGVEFFRERFVPDIKFNEKPNGYGVFLTQEEGIYATYNNGNREYYMTGTKYVEYGKKLGNILLERHALYEIRRRLPIHNINSPKFGINILGYILGLNKSGVIIDKQQLVRHNNTGYIVLGTEVGSPYSGYITLSFNEEHGNISEMGSKDAYPFVFIKSSLY